MSDLSGDLKNAIALIKAQRLSEARKLLLELSRKHPTVEDVWLWLSATATDTQEKIDYLQRALTLNPANPKTRSALLKLMGNPDLLPPAAEPPAHHATSGGKPSGRSAPPQKTGSTKTARAETGLIFVLIGALVIIMVLGASTLLRPILNPATQMPTQIHTRKPDSTVSALIPTFTPGLPPTWTPASPNTPRPAATRPPTLTPRPTSTPKIIPSRAPLSYPAMPQNLQRGSVVRVVDGDTAIISIAGSEKRVRFIGMNTPESVAPNRPQECFGKEASEQAKKLLSGRTVLLEVDASQDQIDQYGRLLRFVWFEDGRLFNMQMIATGYAYEYTYQSFNPHKYQAQFRAAQREADRENRGLWSPDSCNGQR